MASFEKLTFCDVALDDENSEVLGRSPSLRAPAVHGESSLFLCDMIVISELRDFTNIVARSALSVRGYQKICCPFVRSFVRPASENN